jgi:hypothetical protein
MTGRKITSYFGGVARPRTFSGSATIIINYAMKYEHKHMPSTRVDAMMGTCPRGIIVPFGVLHRLEASGNPKLA